MTPVAADTTASMGVTAPCHMTPPVVLIHPRCLLTISLQTASSTRIGTPQRPANFPAKRTITITITSLDLNQCVYRLARTAQIKAISR